MFLLQTQIIHFIHTSVLFFFFFFFWCLLVSLIYSLLHSVHTLHQIYLYYSAHGHCSQSTHCIIYITCLYDLLFIFVCVLYMEMNYLLMFHLPLMLLLTSLLRLMHLSISHLHLLTTNYGALVLHDVEWHTIHSHQTITTLTTVSSCIIYSDFLYQHH